MRAKTKWTPSGIGLWLLAAVVATIAVCTLQPPVDPAPRLPDEVEFEVESGTE